MNAYTVYVEKDLADLIPSFMENRKKEVLTLKEACHNKNFEVIRIIGHSMKGFGSGYGFDFISEIGAILESSGKTQQVEIVQDAIGQLEQYLNNVLIVYE